MDIIKASLLRVDFSPLTCSLWHPALYCLLETLRSDSRGIRATGKGEDSPHRNLNVPKGMNSACTDMESKIFHEDSERQITPNRDMHSVSNYISARAEFNCRIPKVLPGKSHGEIKVWVLYNIRTSLTQLGCAVSAAHVPRRWLTRA